MPIAFGQYLTGSHDTLFNVMRQALFQRDDAAPIDPSKEEYDKWEERRGVTKLRQEMEKCKSMPGHYRENSRKRTEKSKKINILSARIKYIKKTLSVQRVQEMRKDYFAKANELRGKGESTTILASESRKEYTGPFLESLKAATSIGKHMIGECEGDDPFFIQMLVDFLCGRQIQQVPEEAPSDLDQEQHVSSPSNNSRPAAVGFAASFVVDHSVAGLI